MKMRIKRAGKNRNLVAKVGYLTTVVVLFGIICPVYVGLDSEYRKHVNDKALDISKNLSLPGSNSFCVRETNFRDFDYT